MLFAHDTEVSLAATAALVNTAEEPESLTDQEALTAFLDLWGWTGRRDQTDAELRAVQGLRARLRNFWFADEDGVVQIVNDLLTEFRALPQLVRHDEWNYHLHATSLQAPLAARMAVEAAMAWVDVVRSGELSRLRVCDMGDCESVLVDLTKNRSKRYCDQNCSNRAAVQAYRSRRSNH